MKCFGNRCPVSILYKSIAGRYRPVRVADGPITARFRFIKNASWVVSAHYQTSQPQESTIPIILNGCSRAIMNIDISIV